MGIVVEKAGLLTTVQDLGRKNLQKYGVTEAGAMDKREYMVGNFLAGNDAAAASLEVTLIGPELRFTRNCIVAVTGADLIPYINDIPLKMYSAVEVRAEDVLKFKGIKAGCRAYIAFAGGINVPEIMGSRSTDARAKIGGYMGRKLETGDRLEFFEPNEHLINPEFRQLPVLETRGEVQTIRVIMGPQQGMFTEKGIGTFLNYAYSVGSQSDRMGYRLEGHEVELINGGDIISDGIAMGAVQVPSNGKPIVMMADRQTMGGYAKIANVISVDLPKLAQCKPGDKIKFEAVDVETAQKLLIKETAELEEIKAKLQRLELETCKRYNIKVNGISYDVKVKSCQP